MVFINSIVQLYAIIGKTDFQEWRPKPSGWNEEQLGEHDEEHSWLPGFQTSRIHVCKAAICRPRTREQDWCFRKEVRGTEKTGIIFMLIITFRRFAVLYIIIYYVIYDDMMLLWWWWMWMMAVSKKVHVAKQVGMVVQHYSHRTIRT